MRYSRFWTPKKRLGTAVSAAGSIRVVRMLVYGRVRPTADGWPWLTAESAASHVKQGNMGYSPVLKFLFVAAAQLQTGTHGRDTGA